MYAENTQVSVEKSRAEIEKILGKYGAAQFGYMAGDDRAIIAFMAHGKGVKFTLPLPSKSDERFTHRKRRHSWHAPKALPSEVALKAHEQACRSAWRALALCIKAKLEAVECGITSFESEFLAHFVVPGGGTIGDKIIPQLESATKRGEMPTLFLQ